MKRLWAWAVLVVILLCAAYLIKSGKEERITRQTEFAIGGAAKARADFGNADALEPNADEMSREPNSHRERLGGVDPHLPAPEYSSERQWEDYTCDICGLVFSRRDGSPLEGAVVSYLPGGEAVTQTPTLSEREHTDNQLEATVDAQGRFTVARIPRRHDALLLVTSVLHVPSVIAVDTTYVATQGSGPCVDVGAIHLEASCPVNGVVLGDDGKGIVGARIAVVDASSSLLDIPGYDRLLIAESEKEGTFHLDGIPAGMNVLEVCADGWLTGHTNVVTPMAEGGEVEIKLAKGYTIEGRVLQGGRLDGLDQYSVMAVHTAPDGRTVKTGKCDQHGQFVIEGFGDAEKEAMWSLSVVERTMNTTLSMAGAVDALPGMTGITLEVYPSRRVRFRLHDALKTAAIDSPPSVACYSWNGQSLASWSDLGIARRIEGGQYDFALQVYKADENAMGLVIRVDGYEDHALHSVRTDLPGQINLGAIEMVQTPMIMVHVSDKAGHPIEGARVNRAGNRFGADSSGLVAGLRAGLVAIDYTSRTVSQLTDSSGNAVVPALPGQKALLTVSHGAFAVATAEQPSLLESMNSIDVTLERGGRIVVAVEWAGKPASNAAVLCMPWGEGQDRESLDLSWPKSRICDYRGMATFEVLPAGGYKVLVDSGDGPSGDSWHGNVVEGGTVNVKLLHK